MPYPYVVVGVAKKADEKERTIFSIIVVAAEIREAEQTALDVWKKMYAESEGWVFNETNVSADEISLEMAKEIIAHARSRNQIASLN